MEIIAGHIDRDGSIISGEGFDSLQEGQGRYRIMYHAPFNSDYTIVATAGTGSPEAKNLNVSVFAENRASSLIFAQEAERGFAMDSFIHFIAIEL